MSVFVKYDGGNKQVFVETVDNEWVQIKDVPLVTHSDDTLNEVSYCDIRVLKTNTPNLYKDIMDNRDKVKKDWVELNRRQHAK